MTATLRHGSVNGFETIVLENAYLCAVVIPSLGGRVWELEDRARGRQWIWHRGDLALRQAPLGSSYDDVWAGGWEELFPNDAPGWFEGRTLPDHGEWWTMAWGVTDTSRGGVAGVQLSAESTVLRASCTKEFRLEPDASVLSVRYRIQNLETAPVHFLFKQHLPVAIVPNSRLLLPGGRFQAVDPEFGTIAKEGGLHAWPGRDGLVDLRIIPPPSGRAREFVYVRDLPQSWCGVQDPDGASIRMDFNARQLPFVWFFLSYGGWRDLYTAVLEPCTNMPKDLNEAVSQGQAAFLEPGQTFETVVTVTVGDAPGAST